MFVPVIIMITGVILIVIGVCLDIYNRDTNDYKWSEWRIWPPSMWCMLVACILFFSALATKIG